jgi:hypothetical protein
MKPEIGRKESTPFVRDLVPAGTRIHETRQKAGRKRIPQSLFKTGCDIARRCPHLRKPGDGFHPTSQHHYPLRSSIGITNTNKREQNHTVFPKTTTVFLFYSYQHHP